jgi:ubiquinone/menaquinone biosynthesis C-methylase UbiE
MKSELIARQSRRPAGWLGEIVARVMGFETAAANRLALEELSPRAGEAILEVGCGHGRALAQLARVPSAFVAGIDASEVMIRLARRRLDRSISEGRAEVSLATADAIPHGDERFDAALAIHVLYFWTDAISELREIRRVLRPGGRLVIGYRPRDADAVAALPATVYVLWSADEVEGLLVNAGFHAIRSVERAHGGSRFVCTEAKLSAVRGG